MVGKPYQWADGATLEEHSRRKHKILREYVADYLSVRCGYRKRNRFRLAIVDGFAGGGRYCCGAPGSPLIFLEELRGAVERVNVERAAEGCGPVEIDCLLVLNDADRDVVEVLKTNVEPVRFAIAQAEPRLRLCIEYSCEPFENAYRTVKSRLLRDRYTNVLFNLDQCGDSHVDRGTICDIMQSWSKVEIFYTFMISALVAFLQKVEPKKLQKRLGYLGLEQSDVQALAAVMGRQQWLGAAERIVYDAFQGCAPFVSPFSIHNPKGWRYWFIHFANVYRARQVYNNILHDNSSLQAHFGRSGLNMLSYDPRHEDGRLYLFDPSGRAFAKEQLLEDIPRLISGVGGAINVADFYHRIYNITPAHENDVVAAIIENPDLEVMTPAGGARRKGVDVLDVIRKKPQRSFFAMFRGVSSDVD